jgi:PAS domain S-box-containing protein
MGVDQFRLEHFFDMSPALMCIAGYDGYFRKVNPAVINLLGYTLDELLSQPINFFIHPDDRDTTSHYRDNVRKGIPLINFENRYITKSGEVVWLHWTTISDTGNQIIYGVATNVTLRKRQEAERNQLLERLSQINAELTLRSWSTTHDLRSPIGNLLAIFDMLDLSKIKDVETIEFLQMLRSATSSLKGTLDSYLDSLSADPEHQPEIEMVDIDDILNTVEKSLRATLRQRHGVIESDFSHGSTVRFNRGYMESILQNLVSNSIKYAKLDEPLLIRVTLQPNDGKYQLIYTDNGVGFDLEAVQGRLFGFQQSFHDHADSKGIGLYLVQTYMNRFGGHITLASKPGKGATFTLTFKA